MDDYRNKKRQKMRARRRRAQRIKMTGMCIATLIVFIFIVFLAISNLSKIKKNVTLEAGSEINIKDFLKKENADAKFVTDVSQINTGNIGSHEIVVKVGKKEYTSKLTIEDTKAPTAKANDVTVNKDGQIEANQFVTDIKDATKVDVSFKDKPDVSKDGESEVIIVLTDEGKNQKEVKAKLTVVSDSEPPVIEGVKDITAYIGETVSYKKDVTVTDNMDQNPTLDIDNSKVNLNKAGTYEVVYTATDSAGNTSKETLNATVKDITGPEIVLSTNKVSLDKGAQVDLKSYITSAVDNLDGDMKDKITFNTIDTSTTGNKTVTYTGMDTAGNKTEVQLQVEVTFSGERIVNTGLSKRGCPYVWGSTGPNSFDCSGFTQWVYRQNGISIPRTSAEQRASAKKVVSLSELEVGDILWRSGHVGIYIGNGQYVHAPHTGDVVKVSSGIGSFTCGLRYQ